MHHWKSGWPYFGDVEDAAYYISSLLRRWGRVNVTQTKEKYGEAIVYLSFGWDCFHSLTHPGYSYCQYPKWLWDLDISYGSRIVGPLNRIVIPYQQWIYRKAYKRAINKWPHIKQEILAGADYQELLEGI